tara:strand:- start:18 stop:599 length:582 start_codon:yes stop_codon:yes gene_type:complete
MTTIKNFIFYKICCDDNEYVYVGSTCNFDNRKRQHKQCTELVNEKNNLKVYRTIRDNGGWDNWKMIQIGTREQITKREAERIEEDYMKELKAELNDKRAYLTEEVKKEQKAISDKKYRESEKGKEAQERRKDYFEEYNNNEETKTRKHEWYLANKEKISSKAAERYVCSCGKELTIGKKARHEKTTFHINNCK